MIKNIVYFIIFLFVFTSCGEKQKELSDSVSIDSVWTHLERFDKIAKENDFNRSVGSTGGIASKNYIAETLRNLGLEPVEQTIESSSGKSGCNLTVEVKGKSDEAVIMIGSHYDSVIYGPGINDNASGVAALLEIIAVIVRSDIMPEKTLRFAFWDSEETGVEGADFYYNSLNDTDKKRLSAYINIDMIATKDGEIQILDADGSTVEGILKGFEENGVDDETMEMMKEFYGAMKYAKGSEKLEQVLKDIFETYNVPVVEDLTFTMYSDSKPFFAEIPTIGMIVVKQITETNEYGDEIILFAPCYHRECDDINNIDKDMLEVCMKATAQLIQKLAM